ncbi:D-alanine--D-alanine ligase family protein [Yinghuangia seranimata]|uniref:D-alanine--D-alanine ligase family protein n=1 Tax=Yinghuangia seranimata TaxID=408067 RepID=UPI00248BDC25|nr:D-alanine--D-alanine ligase family protein [Yinghuangia seranimata]MDI2129313.1 D-alanine--D-alanine ligase family protein [Yinghuangia seranimata]
MTEQIATPQSSVRPRVAVVFGGRSSEHAISCVTAGSVLSAIDREQYDVLPLGITQDGRWAVVADAAERLAIGASGKLPDVTDIAAPTGSVVLAADPTQRDIAVLETGAVTDVLGSVDVVFPLLHGPYGEDGTLQGLLELAGVPYVGSGVLASAVSMDKEYMKRVFVGFGLPVGPYVTIRPRDWERDPAAVRASVAELGFPVFVKPARAGSSMGITKVHEMDAFDEAVETARKHDPKVIVEGMLRGREIECGVLDGPDGPEASVPAEIRVRGDHEFYDFEAKYLDDVTETDVPADLTAEQMAEVRELAVAAFEAMSCEGLARVDFFLLEDGGWVINEVNTMPGFTPVSMYPQMWKATGVEYPQLVDRLIRAALDRPNSLLR